MRSITKDILSWSKDFLELPSKHLNNFPVCPFAKKTRLNKKISIIEHSEADSLLELIIRQAKQFKDNDDEICIVACDDLYITANELHDYIHALNHVFVPQDVYLMCFHPEDDGEEEPINFLEDTSWQPHNEFLMVLIQPYDALERASSQLTKTNYYNNWPKDYYDGTVNKRKQYRRLRHERYEKKSKKKHDAKS
mgnify:FL=1